MAEQFAIAEAKLRAWSSVDGDDSTDDSYDEDFTGGTDSGEERSVLCCHVGWARLVGVVMHSEPPRAQQAFQTGGNRLPRLTLTPQGHRSLATGGKPAIGIGAAGSFLWVLNQLSSLPMCSGSYSSQIKKTSPENLGPLPSPLVHSCFQKDLWYPCLYLFEGGFGWLWQDGRIQYPHLPGQ